MCIPRSKSLRDHGFTSRSRVRLHLEGILSMLRQQKLMISLALFGAMASAGPVVYVVGAQPNGAGQFGTVDLTSGAFTQIGPTEPDGYFGLAGGPNGSYLAL